MKAGGSLGMDADDDGWADEMTQRWFDEFETEQGQGQGQGDVPSWEDQRAVD